MRRFTCLLLLLTTGVASADVIAPPRLPKGKKYVSVTSEVLLGKNVTGWVFLQQATDPKAAVPKFQYTRLTLDDKTPVTMPEAQGPFGGAFLVAVPEEAAKKFATDKELFEALEATKVKGVVVRDFVGQVAVSDKVKDTSVTWTHTITGVDAKRGTIKMTIRGPGAPDGPAEKKEDKSPLAVAEPSYLIGGAAAALCVTFGGLWLVRRRK